MYFFCIKSLHIQLKWGKTVLHMKNDANGGDQFYLNLAF